MKHNMFRKLGMWLLAATLMVACSEDETTPEVAPDFPASTTAEVVAGEVYTFTISPNTVWSLALTDASVNFFTLLDGESEVYRLRGEAGTHEIKVRVSSFDEFDCDRTGELVLTLGTGSLQETRTILTLTRTSIARSLSVMIAEYDAAAEDFARDENSNLIYGASSDKMEYIYDAYNYVYLQRFAVESNFEWVFTELPAWFGTNEVTEGTAGRTEIFSRVNATAHPFADTTFELGFLDVSNPNDPKTLPNTVTVSLPGCEDFCVVNRIGAKVEFDKDGAFDNNGALVETGVLGDFMAPLGARLYVAAKVEGIYSFAEAATSWLTLTEELPEGASTEYGIWSRALTLVAAPNTEAAREAVLVAVPQTVAKTLSSPVELLTDDMTAFKEASYVVSTLTQASGLPEDVEAVKAVNPDDLKGWGSSFAEMQTGVWPWMGSWASIPHAYKLIHSTVDAISDFYIQEYASYRIFGFDGEYAEYSDLETCWITVEEGQMEGSKRIKMRLGESYTAADGTTKTYENTLAGYDGENEATIVFYDAAGNALTMVYCILDETFKPGGDVDSGAVSFVDAAAAAAAGVFIEPIVEGDADYDAELAHKGVPQYYVIFKQAATVALNVPAYIYGQAYAEWLTFEQTGETVATLTATATTTGAKSAVSLYASMGMLGSEEAAHLICVYNPDYVPAIPEEPISFVDQAAADALGATLTPLVKGDADYSDELAFMEIPQYRLTMKKAGTLTFKVPEFTRAIEYTWGAWITVNPDWSETPISELSVTMTSTGTAVQNSRITLHNGDETQVMAILCKLTNEE